MRPERDQFFQTLSNDIRFHRAVSKESLADACDRAATFSMDFIDFLRQDTAQKGMLMRLSSAQMDTIYFLIQPQKRVFTQEKENRFADPTPNIIVTSDAQRDDGSPTKYYTFVWWNIQDKLPTGAALSSKKSKADPVVSTYFSVFPVKITPEIAQVSSTSQHQITVTAGGKYLHIKDLYTKEGRQYEQTVSQIYLGKIATTASASECHVYGQLGDPRKTDGNAPGPTPWFDLGLARLKGI